MSKLLHRLERKVHSMTNYRAEEYYDYQKVKENLYDRAIQGERFHDILSKIVEENNLRMRQRKIKTNKGSKTKGSDEYTIEDVKCPSLEEYLRWMKTLLLNYQPSPVRRKYIPKPNGDKRPLGIPCIRDRLAQESVLQILEPMLESKMSQHSFGFRKGRSVQDAIEYSRNLVRI
jgi:retron-type reverse transcriptase